MYMNTFAAIDVGSNEVSMKIYEISKGAAIREIDHVRQTIELGSETYTNGKISYPMVNELCEILQNFRLKMKEYQVNDYTAYATSALREASNQIVILDQIKLRCGLKVKILSNSEQRFLCYKAITLQETTFQDMIKKGTAIVDVGSGSMQISLFDKEALVSTQNIRQGSMRVREKLSQMEKHTDNFKNLISEYIDHEISTYMNKFFKNKKIKNIIAVGDQLNEMLRSYKKFSQADYLEKADFNELYSYLFSKSIDDLSKNLDISREEATLALPTAMIYHKVLEKTKAEGMWIPSISLCEGIAIEYAEKKIKLKQPHNFTEDIIQSSRNIAKRYESNTKHCDNVEYTALSIFDKIRKLHGLGKRERLLLQIAIILHNCGGFINMNDVPENSYKIILATEIIGLSHQEREMVAYLVRYNVDNFPSYNEIAEYMNHENYLIIVKLTAILRVANALDASHKQKFSNINISLRDTVLTITATTLEDITLERGLFDQKANFFEEVYGIRPIIKQKRSL